MKHKLFALILALTVVSWAQNATQSAPDSQQGAASTEKAKCGCCDKMASADAKDAKMSCMRHAVKNGKDGACCGGKDCCAGKDAKSCMKNTKAGSCCKDCGKDKTASACCGKDCKECSCSGKKEKTAKNCCEHALHS
jgi:hypothetical protein